MADDDLPRRRPTGPDRASQAWRRLEAGIAVGALAVAVGLLLIDVAGRELLAPLLRLAGAAPWPLHGGSRIAVYAFIVACFAGLGLAAADGTMLRIRPWRTTARRERVLGRIADAVSALCLAVAAWTGAVMVREPLEFGLTAPPFHWPLWPLQLAVPIGFASAALHLGCRALWPQVDPGPGAVAR